MTALIAPANGMKVMFYRWWQTGPTAVCAVARLSMMDGNWAAYIAGVHGPVMENLHRAIEYTADLGAKLTEEEARFFFPEMVAIAEAEGLTYRR